MEGMDGPLCAPMGLRNIPFVVGEFLVACLACYVRLAVHAAGVLDGLTPYACASSAWSTASLKKSDLDSPRFLTTASIAAILDF